LLTLDPSISIPIDVEPAHAGQYCSTLIFDLGDVLFTWSAETESAISSNTLRKILRSATWFEYEKGMFTECEAYSRVAEEFGVAYADVKRAFQGARASLAPNEGLVALIRDLKSQSKDHELKIFGMSNISMPDWEVLQTKGRPEDWLLFERVFTSAEAMERKPNLGFYQHVIREITKYSDAQPKSEVKGHNLNWTFDPTSTIFVDDKLENVVSARSCGLRGLQFTSFEILAQSLRNAILTTHTSAQLVTSECKEYAEHYKHGCGATRNFFSTAHTRSNRRARLGGIR
jgi:FMN phosphatase YigB (HAD superfamily)